jgi:hypothetical protein
MIRELDAVVLVHDVEAYGLTQGDVGAVVHCYKDGKTFEVEFVTGEGTTIAVLTLSQHDILPCMPGQSCMSARSQRPGASTKTTQHCAAHTP